MDKAYVIFCDGQEQHPLSWMLKKGFRHVFCIIKTDGYWVLVDGRDGRPAVEVHGLESFDLAQCYRDMGLLVVPAEQGKGRDVPFVLNNCVGMVKAVLGLKSKAITPYQLYKYLVRA